MNHSDLIRRSTLLVIMAVHAAVSDGAAQWDYLSTKATVNLSSWASVIGGVYVVLGSLVCTRRVMKKPPPLTTDTVFVYVYGLGSLLFVATYSGLGCNLNTTFAFAVGTAGVCIDDILALRSESRVRRAVWVWCIVLSVAAVSTFWLDLPRTALFERQVDAGSVFEIVYGVALPIALPFLFHLVRAPPQDAGATSVWAPRVGPTVILELLGIGGPLAVLLSTIGAFTFGAPPAVDATSMRLANLTLDAPLAADEPDGAYTLLFLAALPFTVGAWLFFLLQSVILYRTTEFLVIWCVVGAVRHCLHDITSLASQAGCALAFKALLTLLCLGQMGSKELVRMQPSTEYQDDEENSMVLMYQPEAHPAA